MKYNLVDVEIGFELLSNYSSFRDVGTGREEEETWMMMIVVFLCSYDLFAIAPGIKVEEHYLATAIAMKSKNELVFTLRIVQEMI